MKYARIEEGKVVELWEPGMMHARGIWRLEQCFHPDIVAQFVRVPPHLDVTEGWAYSYADNTFTPPAKET